MALPPRATEAGSPDFGAAAGSTRPRSAPRARTRVRRPCRRPRRRPAHRPRPPRAGGHGRAGRGAPEPGAAGHLPADTRVSLGRRRPGPGGRSRQWRPARGAAATGRRGVVAGAWPRAWLGGAGRAWALGLAGWPARFGGRPQSRGGVDGQLSWNTRRGVDDWTQVRLVSGARAVRAVTGRPAGCGARDGPNPPDSRWEQLRPFVLGLVLVFCFALRGTFSLTPRSAWRPRGRERAMEGPGPESDEPGEARPAVRAPVVPLRVRLGFLQLWRALAARLAAWAWWLTAQTRSLGGLPRLPRHLPPSVSWLKDSEARGLVGLALRRVFSLSVKSDQHSPSVRMLFVGIQLFNGLYKYR